MTQIEWLYDQLQSLSTETLIRIIDELDCGIPDNAYKEMATDVYNKAKARCELTHKQKRVLVNIIGQPRRG
ncbi:hypothetical protein [Bacillus badius]|uniref:hypothetical protein n=1 Tax=Bacillus badius TaxID=1455 RepID=UPI0006974CF0|nr:hypothetical protein [Bacillus badius]MED4718260.1 hypothetical protein [Bacillus badius]